MYDFVWECQLVRNRLMFSLVWNDGSQNLGPWKKINHPSGQCWNHLRQQSRWFAFTRCHPIKGVDNRERLETKDFRPIRFGQESKAQRCFSREGSHNISQPRMHGTHWWTVFTNKEGLVLIATESIFCSLPPQTWLNIHGPHTYIAFK